MDIEVFSYTLVSTVVGLFVVFSFLAILAIVMVFLGKWDMAKAAKKDAPKDGGKAAAKTLVFGCQMYADGGIETCKIGNLELAAYVGGYDFNDAWFGKLAQMVGTEGIQAILTVGSGVDVLGGFIAGSGVKLATVDSFTPAMKEAMDNGILDYMAGKFAASIGPIFAATLNAINGQPIRDAEGNALALGQGYWVATNSEQFAEYSAVDSSMTDPAYTKEILDQYAAPGISYDDFAAFVAQYAFDEIVALKK